MFRWWTIRIGGLVFYRKRLVLRLGMMKHLS